MMDGTPATAPTIAEQLAGYWAGVELEDLPADVIAMGKRVLLDTLVVGLRGAQRPEPQAVTRAMTASGARHGDASAIWGTGLRTTPHVAALINGTASHALELDDFGGCGHSGAVVIPAVSAIADARALDGRAVLKAVLAGYDVAARVLEGAGGYRPHAEKGWHSTSTCGVFGSAMGAGVALGLDARRLAWALGIAGSYAAGTWAFITDGADTKRLHPGRTAEAGVSAAYLAAADFTGPAAIFEAPWGGFFSLFAGDVATPEKTVADLGRTFGVMGTGIKLFACCRGLHSSVEALLDIMRRESLAARDIAKIVVHGADRTVRQFSKRDVRTTLDAQFSLAYALAVTALEDRAGFDQFSPMRTDADTEALMDRVDVLADRSLGPYDEPDIEVYLKTGVRFAGHVPVTKGMAARPADEEDLREKHDGLAMPVLGAARLDRLRAALSDLENVPDFRQVTALLSAGGEMTKE